MSEDGVMDELDRAREEMAAQWSTIRDLRSQLAAEREASADLRRQLDERNAELETMYVVTMTLGRLQDNERIAKLLGKVSMIEHEQQEIAK